MQSCQSHLLLLKNIKQVAPVSISSEEFIRLKQCSSMPTLLNQCISINLSGKIQKIFPVTELQTHYPSQMVFKQVIDCTKYCALPGFVDSHTHSLFMGDRSKQYEMKLNGMNYVDIYNQGLGIRYTTQSVAKATLQQLVSHLDRYLPRMSKLGTTTLQIKSGYGLDAENQVKMLKAIQIARKKYQDRITIIATFCGAHAIPKGKTQIEQTKDVIENQIPAVQKSLQAKDISPVFCDVFCEKNFFEEESSIKIMQAGKEIGLVPSFHGDQLNNLQSGSIGSKVGARSISHLQYLSQKSIQLMSANKIVGILLPTTQNIEKLPIPPIKKMREQNMIVALGSDFCPNAFCYNMSLAAHFACTNYRLTPKQALAAVTLNSAYALQVQDTVGSIEVGKDADLLLLDAQQWVYFVYSFGDNFIEKVIKKGKIL